MQKLTYCAATNLYNHAKLVIIPLIIGFILSGCAPYDFTVLNPLQKMQMELSYFNAESLRKDARYLEAAEELWSTMQDLPPPYRERMQIKAASILVEGNHILNAFQYLRQIDESVINPKELLKKRILDGKFYAHTSQPEKVVAMLPTDIVDKGDKQLQIEALNIRAENLFLVRRYIDSVSDRIRRDSLLDDPEIKYANTLDLWKALISENIENVNDKIRNEGSNRNLKAWLELAQLATPAEINREELEINYIKWKRQNSFLDLPDNLHQSLQARWNYLDFVPKKIALLLPLTGKFAKSGKAIRDGFMKEYKLAGTDTQVHVLNTDQPTDIVKIYQQVVKEGADLVVGPLLKSKVEKLIENIDFKIPSIMLNYSAKNYEPRGEVFQFGLLPEDEASQVANKMIKKGHKFTLMLTPDNEWGGRLKRRFTEEYVKHDGKIQEVVSYDPSFSKYASVIQAALRLDESRRRHRLVEETIETQAKFTPRIRDDITSAVIFSNYDKGILIYPLIKFYYGNELPVFTTSHIYNPTGKKLLRELDGMLYCDIPAVINSNKNIAMHKKPRLFALGMDAFNISKMIRRIGLGNTKYEGMTGDIELHNNGHLFRNLSWARFRRGSPVPLGTGW